MKMKKLQKEIHKITESYIGQTITPELKSEIENKIAQFLLSVWMKKNAPTIEVQLSELIYNEFGEMYFFVSMSKKKNTFSEMLKKLNNI